MNPLESLQQMMLSPFCGGVNQDYHPDTSWFSPTVNVEMAGHQKIERDVVTNTASYGKQIGLMMDILVVLAEKCECVDTEQFHADVKRLKDIHTRIENTKKHHRGSLAHTAVDTLDALKRDNPKYYEDIIRVLFGGLSDPDKSNQTVSSQVNMESPS